MRDPLGRLEAIDNAYVAPGIIPPGCFPPHCDCWLWCLWT
jgi:hypothetical protein